jgi:RNA polymerase sigma factor (sigma-70 family)
VAAPAQVGRGGDRFGRPGKEMRSPARLNQGMAGRDNSRVDSIEEVYRAQYGRFVRTAGAIAGSRERGADAVHDAFVAAVRDASRLPEGSGLAAWLWRAVVNAARDARRSEARRAGLGLDAYRVDVASNGAGEQDELRRLVAALPERQRLTLFLRYYADLDYASIAEVLGVAPGTVAATLHAAHAALRPKLEQEVLQ